MEDIKQLEGNVIESFRLARNDIAKAYSVIIKLQTEVELLKSANSKLSYKVAQNEATVQELQAKINNVKVKKEVKETNFIGSTASKKLHSSACFFAKKVKVKNKVKFDSRIEAFREGYNLCRCLA